jgi:hypothetical protein
LRAALVSTSANMAAGRNIGIRNGARVQVGVQYRSPPASGSCR